MGLLSRGIRRRDQSPRRRPVRRRPIRRDRSQVKRISNYHCPSEVSSVTVKFRLGVRDNEVQPNKGTSETLPYIGLTMANKLGFRTSI